MIWSTTSAVPTTLRSCPFRSHICELFLRNLLARGCRKDRNWYMLYFSLLFNFFIRFDWTLRTYGFSFNFVFRWTFLVLLFNLFCFVGTMGAWWKIILNFHLAFFSEILTGIKSKIVSIYQILKVAFIFIFLLSQWFSLKNLYFRGWRFFFTNVLDFFSSAKLIFSFLFGCLLVASNRRIHGFLLFEERVEQRYLLHWRDFYIWDITYKIK